MHADISNNNSADTGAAISTFTRDAAAE